MKNLGVDSGRFWDQFGGKNALLALPSCEFQKILRTVPNPKQTSFLGPKWGKNYLS